MNYMIDALKAEAETCRSDGSWDFALLLDEAAAFIADLITSQVCAQARLTASTDVLDAITTPDGELRLPATDEEMARLRAAFEAAKAVP